MQEENYEHNARVEIQARNDLMTRPYQLSETRPLTVLPKFSVFFRPGDTKFLVHDQSPPPR